MSQYEGTGEPLVSVEAAASLCITDPRHWSIATWSPNIESGDPYSHVMSLLARKLCEDVLVPGIDILQGDS